MNRIRGLFNRLTGRGAAVAPRTEPIPAIVPEAQLPPTENGVLHGRDGWLFLWDGSNDVHRYYTDPDYFTATDVAAWRDLITGRDDRITGLGARYRHLTVPDKLSVYPQYLPAGPLDFDRHPALLLARAFPGDAPYVDILPDLRDQRGDWPGRVAHGSRDARGSDAFFFRTDSHWTFEGCQVAYIRLCESLGVAPLDLTDRRPNAGRELALDLGAKLSPPVQELAQFGRVLRDSRRVSANEMVRYNEAEGFARGEPRFVGCTVHNHNDKPGAIDARLVVFGDSFCEFRPHLLTAMLSETFRDVHFVWSTNLDYDFIRNLAPDIVITEIAERFSKRIPTDDFTVSTD